MSKHKDEMLVSMGLLAGCWGQSTIKSLIEKRFIVDMACRIIEDENGAWDERIAWQALAGISGGASAPGAYTRFVDILVNTAKLSRGESFSGADYARTLYKEYQGSSSDHDLRSLAIQLEKWAKQGERMDDISMIASRLFTKSKLMPFAVPGLTGGISRIDEGMRPDQIERFLVNNLLSETRHLLSILLATQTWRRNAEIALEKVRADSVLHLMVDVFCQYPIVTGKEIRRRIRRSSSLAANQMKRFEKVGLVDEITGNNTWKAWEARGLFSYERFRFQSLRLADRVQNESVENNSGMNRIENNNINETNRGVSGALNAEQVKQALEEKKIHDLESNHRIEKAHSRIDSALTDIDAILARSSKFTDDYL